MIEVLYSGPASLEGSRSPCNQDEHRVREHRGKRPPRRAQTQHEDFLPSPAAVTISTIIQRPQLVEDGPKSPSAPPDCDKEVDRARRPARRPPLGPPRRSYSVTDRQPIPRRNRLPARLALLDLPAEIHYSIMDFLDPIDSVCLGLTNKHFYAIHRRLHGTVPLTARRDGPNDLEWAWHTAGNIVRKNPANMLVGDKGGKPDDPVAAAAVVAPAPLSPLKGLGEEERHALSRLRVRGQGYCRMCGVTRCQLHKHIQEWMGEQFEYCSVRQSFGPVAPEGAKSYCYMSKPGDAKRCGRHFSRARKVELR